MNIDQDDKNAKERRTSYLKKVRKAEYRKRSMFCVTKYLGKGPNTSLSKVKIANSQNVKIWYYNKNNIKNEIINHSK